MTEKKKKNCGGRPTKYDKSYCNKLLEFFSIDHTKEIEKTVVDKSGKKYTESQEVANSLPTFEGFAVSIGVHRETLRNWCEEYEEFFAAYKKAQDYQKNMLIDLGMRGFYNPTFTIFVAKNITDMKDKVEQNVNLTGALTTVDFGDE